MREFSLLIKPASFDCNLRCAYCFYLKKEEVFGNSIHRMSDEVLEKMVSSFLDIEMSNHSFAWQGGEPSVMGVDFYQRAITMMKKHGDEKNVANALQTNGTLLNDDWGKLLRDFNFLVGLSMDGPAELHDLYRKDAGGKGTHKKVYNTIKLLRRHRVEFNILTLVSQANIKHPLEVYRYLKKLGIKYHQYIECFETAPGGGLAPFAVSGVEWGKFMCRIFDEWYKGDRYDISVRLFDSILHQLVEKRSNVCNMGRDCRQYLVVEYNGDVFPCDFFVEPRFKLGNVMENSFQEMIDSDLYKEFGKRKTATDEVCGDCQWIDLCAGCCPKNRPDRAQDAKTLSELCAGWKMFYSHTYDRFKELAKEIRFRRETEQRVQVHRQLLRMFQQGNIGLEAPCPCGSGLLLKQCMAPELNQLLGGR
ncbi:MAG: anaerobic sulfatase maturase [Lentisphaerae bacterium]|nr:anaerobic sulfatase maturase [Lentisphaerota bacterium]MCP4102082.1 anaerobic sulfatase maturase [Lentisphaerota bacterium]